MNGKSVSNIYNSATSITGTDFNKNVHATCCSGRIRSVLVTRAIALLLLICLVECAAGSCLSYGHSCWGAHGKRSGPTNEANTWISRHPANAAEAWYFAKVLGRLAPNSELVRRSSEGVSDSFARADLRRLWKLRRAAQRDEAVDDSEQDKYNASMDINGEVDSRTAEAARAAAARAVTLSNSDDSDDVTVTSGRERGRERTDNDRLVQIMREAAEEN